MKRFISFIVSISVIVSALGVPMSVFASSFATTIGAFEYNGYCIPAYDGDAYEIINENSPEFTSSQLNQNIYEKYGALDSLGRVTECSANIDQSLKPEGEREEIGSVYPTGWVQNKYDFVNNKYLYNRSHLIAFQLTGENANKKNLMTGTRTFNVVGMLPFENQVAAYIRQDPENNVLYRVTPVFRGNNLLAYGVIMEAESVDDLGKSIKFCVFVYNIEPGVAIDYSSGLNVQSGEKIDLAAAYIELSKYTYAYTGNTYKPTAKVMVKYAKLPSDCYTVNYTNNKNVGTATVTVTGKGACKGSKKVTFKIVPKSTGLLSVAAGKKSATLKWRRQTVQTTGYQIQFSTSSKFTSPTTFLVKSNKTATRKVTKLKSKKKYYFRIRTYKTVSGKKYYSAWSKSKAIKVK